MAESKKSLDEKLKNSYLKHIQELQFSKDDKSPDEVAQIERTILTVKLAMAVKCDAVPAILEDGLKTYGKLVDDQSGVNNYWPHIKSQKLNVKNDPKKWVSGLTDVSQALQFLKPLPCQTDVTKGCKGLEYTDRHIEKFMEMWQGEPNQPVRKVSSSASSFQPKETKTLPVKSQPAVRPNAFNRDNFSSFNRDKTSTSGRENSNVFKRENPNAFNRDNTNLFGRDTTKVINRNNLSSFNRENPTNFNRENATNFNRENPSNFNRENSKVFNRDNPRTIPSSNNQYFNQHSSNQRYPGNVQSNVMRPNKPPLHPKGPVNAGRDSEESTSKYSGFRTARDELNIQMAQKNKQQPQKKTLGGKGSVNSKFVCPVRRDNNPPPEPYGNADIPGAGEGEEVDERLKNIDPKMIELIKNEIMDSGSLITWNDIAGLEYAKKIIKEIVVFPMLRPDIFTGLRRPPKGILLFGPPGTGKTLIGKCIASQSKSTFFSISASSLTSKWIGEGEKMVRALFAVARVHQPAVVFIDEIDSLLTQRSETEHESSRRIKTEFLVQLDGAATGDEDRILIVGATNRPYELDEAARRRLVKRLYIPLPEEEARGQIVMNLLKSERHDLTMEDVQEIARMTDGYSGADVTNLCKEASMGPIRSIPFSQLEDISTEAVRQVTMEDFVQAIHCVRPSVSKSDLNVYLDWDKTYGSGTANKN